MISSVRELTLKHFDIEVKEYPDLKISYCDNEFFPRGRKGLDPVVISDSFDWSEDRYKDRNWMFQLHSLRVMDPYLINAVRCLRKGNFEHAVWCAEHGEKILNGWIDFHKKKKSKYQWYDMSVGLRALRIVLLHYILCFAKGASYGEQYIRVLEEHLDNLSDESKINKGNHGLFQISALKCVAEVLIQYGIEAGRENYKSVSSLASRLMVDHVKSQFTENGLHVENSPDYHFFVLSKVKSFLACPWWGELFENQEIRVLLEKAEVLKYWLVDPYGRCLPVGDSSESQRVKDFSDIMWDVEKISYKGYASFCIDGYYQVRGLNKRKKSLLFFMGAHHSNVHQHDDLQSLIWQEKGEYLLLDGGKYGYKSDKYRGYFKSSEAHNVLTVKKNSGQEVCFSSCVNTVEKYGVNSKGIWFVVSSNSSNMEGCLLKKKRSVFFFPGVGVIVLDSVENKGAEVLQGNVSWNIPLEKNCNSINIAMDKYIFDKFVFKQKASCGSLSVKLVSGESDVCSALQSRSYLAFDKCTKIISCFSIPADSSLDIVSLFLLKDVAESESAMAMSEYESLGFPSS